MRPNVKSIFKSFGALFILGVVAIFANSMLPGANYLYVARPESTSSILDFLPTNYTVRLIIIVLIISVMFFLCYLPWLIKDVKAKRKQKNNNLLNCLNNKKINKN